MTELILILIVILFISFVINRNDLCAPSFVFTFSFLFSAIWAKLYENEWDLLLHLNTFFVIIIGIIIFNIVCKIIDLVKINNDFNYQNVDNKLKIISISKRMKNIIIFLEVVVIVLVFYNIIKITGSSLNYLSDALYKYRITSDYNLPRVVRLLKNLTYSLSFYFSYVLINNYFVEKKIDIRDGVIVFLSVIASISTGARGDAVNIFIAFFVMCYLFLYKSNNYKINLKFKHLLIIIVSFVIGLLLFRMSVNLLGRKNLYNNIGILDYIAEYCGAEIKNLDSFLQEFNNEKPEIWGSQTFFAIINWYGHKFKNEKYIYLPDIPFRSINGYSLGNVYTIFYTFVYDFGYGGIIPLITIMAIISQIIYKLYKKSNFKEQNVNFYLILYSYIFPQIFFSFFSNKFYEYVFNINFIYFCIFIYFVNYIVTKFNDK